MIESLFLFIIFYALIGAYFGVALNISLNELEIRDNFAFSDKCILISIWPFSVIMFAIILLIQLYKSGKVIDALVKLPVEVYKKFFDKK